MHYTHTSQHTITHHTQHTSLNMLCAGNLHQSQYCDKIRSIVEFLGAQLSMEELTTMWEMQVEKNPMQV